MKSRLAKAMEAHGVTRAELMCELTKRSYDRVDDKTREEVMSRFEDGRVLPNCFEIRALRNMCKICNCSANYLLGLSENMTQVL